MAKLKVFCWSDGFHAYPVAVTSRPKALEAWGVNQDLFKTGMATELTEGADFEAALAAPGEVLERRLEVNVSGEPAKAKSKAKPAKAVVREKPKPPSKAALARVAKAKRALEALEDRQAAEREAADERVQRAEAALDTAREAVRGLASKQRKSREQAEAALTEARDALAS